VAFGFTDFLTNVGGFLGLYLGCSFISVLETFHFLFAYLHGKFVRREAETKPDLCDSEFDEMRNHEFPSIELVDLEDTSNSTQFF
jgi:hypothetical protein